jgi:purine-binding chemotaxis protein CheW
VRSFVRGIISVRGTIVPILDLQRRLSQQEESDLGTSVPVASMPTNDVASGGQSVEANLQRRVLITQLGGEVFGLLVDEVSDVFVADPDDIEPPPATLPRRLLEFVSGIARVQGRIHTVLEVPAVLRFSAVARAYRRAEVVR